MMVAKLQSAATWVRFDIAFAVGQLARFEHLQGRTFAALHHFVKYPSFHLDYLK